MILCNYSDREDRIFDWIQTYFTIADERDLRVLSVEPSINGFEIVYSIYMNDIWNQSKITLFNSQILLFESFRK